MDFIKKHYEKIILGAVLLILAGAVIVMLIQIPREKAELKEKTEKRAVLSNKPLPPPDTARFDAAFGRVEKPAALNFSGSHNLFNPVAWQKQPDGRLTKKPAGGATGAAGVTVLKMNPLYTVVSFESASAPEGPYLVSIERTAEIKPASRRKQSKFVTLKVKGDLGTLQSVKFLKDTESTNDIPQLTMELADTGETVTIWTGHPYKRVDGYSADLFYEADKKPLGTRRVGDRVLLGGEEFTVAAINLVATNQFEVVLSAKLTGKKTTIRYNAAL